MEIIKLSNLKTTLDRQRQEFDQTSLAELSSSIEAHGLLHPPVVRFENSEYILVAGERRIRAIQDIWELGGELKYGNQTIPQGSIPVLTLHELTYLEAEEIELDENLKRKDLTWQEHAQAVSRLHHLRQSQAKIQGKAHTIAETALELKGRADGDFQGSTRKEIIVAKHLSNPEVAKAKTAEEAFKILKRQENETQNILLSEAVGKTFSADSHSLHNADCLNWMSDYITSDSPKFDCILTDPPYGMGADNFGDSAGRMTNFSHEYEDSYSNWTTLMNAWAKLSFSITKEQAHAYVFCDIDRFHELRNLMLNAGWTPFRTPFIVGKAPGSGRVPLPEHGPRRQWECLLYAFRGKKTVNRIASDLVVYNSDADSGHGAQKPVALFVDLLERSCKPGDSVLDTFAGSGTIFPAAHSLKVAATGIEMSSNYFGACVKRLGELK